MPMPKEMGSKENGMEAWLIRKKDPPAGGTAGDLAAGAGALLWPGVRVVPQAAQAPSLTVVTARPRRSRRRASY